MMYSLPEDVVVIDEFKAQALDAMSELRSW
jgi:hypothetical protein